MIAYRDWLNKPTKTKKILPIKINIKWYKIKESTFSKINIDGPQIKFWENNNWEEYNKDKNIGAKAVVGLGIKKTSLVSILNKSKAIWKAPFLPIIAGPIRLCAYAKNFLSTKTTNNVKKTEKSAKIKADSLKLLKQK